MKEGGGKIVRAGGPRQLLWDSLLKTNKETKHVGDGQEDRPGNSWGLGIWSK